MALSMELRRATTTARGVFRLPLLTLVGMPVLSLIALVIVYVLAHDVQRGRAVLVFTYPVALGSGPCGEVCRRRLLRVLRYPLSKAPETADRHHEPVGADAFGAGCASIASRRYAPCVLCATVTSSGAGSSGF